MNLVELQKKFPTARFHYEPTPDCKRCKGRGYFLFKFKETEKDMPCGCLFFGPHTTEIVPLIAAAARRVRKEMGL